MVLSFLEPEPNKQDNQSMAESVTRHAQNPSDSNYELLLCGIDTLDIGLFVKWVRDWKAMAEYFEAGKEQAQKDGGYLDFTADGREFLHLPIGKAPNYRFHIQFPEYHLYISITREASTSPNLYVSLNSETLWRLGIQGAVDIVRNDIECMGGLIEKYLPSRCDFCVDFKMPMGITEEFLKIHRVSRSIANTSIKSGECLETYYLGSPKAPIRLRIYDKGKQVLKKGKLWFLDLWGTEDIQDIWRVEYQLRRSALRQFNIYTLDDLKDKCNGIWRYLTNDWFSLRIPDNEKKERCMIHPWWIQLQECADKFGPTMEVQRSFDALKIPAPTWYVYHIAGCLPSFAARCGITDMENALDLLMSKVKLHWSNKSFEREFLKRAIKLGLATEKFDEADYGTEE